MEKPAPDEARPEKRPRRESPNGAAVAAPPGPPSAPPPVVRPKVLLANLVYDVKEENLRDFFEGHGLKVDSIKLLGISPHNSSMCNGNAFVTFMDDRSAAGAEKLDRTKLQGRDIRIFSTRNGNPRTACVRGMRQGTTERDIRELFQGCAVRELRSAPQRGAEPNDPMTWFVDFEDDQSFEKALTFDRTQSGLFICVATAPSGGNKTPRESRDFRDSWRRDDRRDGRYSLKRSRSPPYNRHREPDRYRGRDQRSEDRRSFDRREFDRRDPARRDLPRRDHDRRDHDRRDHDRRDSERRDPDRRNPDRRDTERRDVERRDSEPRGNERRDPERRDPERRDPERSASERRTAERNGADRRPVERNGPERRDSARHEADRRIPDRHDADRRIPERHEPDRAVAERRESDRPIPERRESDHAKPDRRESDRLMPDRRASDRVNSDQRDPIRKDEAVPRVPEHPDANWRNSHRNNPDHREAEPRGPDARRNDREVQALQKNGTDVDAANVKPDEKNPADPVSVRSPRQSRDDRSRGADRNYDRNVERSRSKERSRGSDRIEHRRDSDRYNRSRDPLAGREVEGNAREKGTDRSRDYDRRSTDDGDHARSHRREDSRGRSRDRDRDHDRSRDRRDRDRRDRDRYSRDYDRTRDRGDGGDYGRRSVNAVGGQIDHADRFYHKDLVEDRTVIITNLPFADNRDMASRDIIALMNGIEGIKARIAYPIGRRCGSCFVVLETRQSYEAALRRRSMHFMGRNIHFYALEKPYTVRVHRLATGFTAEGVLEDLRSDFGISGTTVSSVAADNMFIELDSLKYLIHLLAADGYPHRNGRLLSVSYCLPRRALSNGSSQRRQSKDFDDEGGRGRDDHRSGPSEPPRGPRGPSKDRDGKPEDREADSKRDGSARNAGARRASEWRVRLLDLPPEFSEEVVYSFLSENGINGVLVSRIAEKAALVQGRLTDESVFEATKRLDKQIFCSAKFNVKGGSCRTESLSPRPLPDPSVETAVPPPKMDEAPKPMDTSTVVGKRRESPGKEDPPAAKKHRKEPCHISPLTPSPSTPSTKLRRVDPELPEISARLDRVLPMILDDKGFPDNADMADFCGNLDKYVVKQKLDQTLVHDGDTPIPHVWSGSVWKGFGPRAYCDGYLILRADQKDEDITQTIDILPQSLEIEHRIQRNDPGFSHLLSKKSVAFIVRTAEQETDKMMSLSPQGRSRQKSSRSALLDILQSLRQKRRLGLVRYSVPKKEGRFAALCIPPETDIMDQLGIPWRFRDLVVHDSIILVVGRKATLAMLKGTKE